MKISIIWDDSQHHPYTDGEAEVVEPCCEAIRKSPHTFYFNVWRKKGIIMAAFHQDCEDGIEIPLRFCPACGEPVKVIEEILKTAIERKPRGFFKVAERKELNGKKESKREV